MNAISQTSNFAIRLDIVDRLVQKMTMSQTQVPGFIVGLSGTDSIVAFDILNSALARMDMGGRLKGIHYVAEGARPGAFVREAIPWMQNRYGKEAITVATPLGGNHDPQRWADLQLRSINEISKDDSGQIRIAPLEQSESYWVAGTINATEHALGKHSIGANAVSIQPIRSIWKSDIMEACKIMGVPQLIMDNARLPDCLCGRDEIAAEHIELIDDILKYRFDVRAHDPELVMTLMQWVSDRKREGGFRSRIPYIV